MRPKAVGRMFSLEHPPVPDAIAHIADRHWLVTYELPDGVEYRSEVLTHPSVHIVAEPHGTFVYGVATRRDVRVLSGSGYAAGTRFLPGGFGALIDGPVADLTDRVVPVQELFGDAGEELAVACANTADRHEQLALTADFIARAARPLDAGAELVKRVVADILAAPPGTRVEDLARRHHSSTRSLQRLFRRHVGVGPKWVLQRYRLHTALERLEAGAEPDWTRMALDLGYFDHAHFIRDFRTVVGQLPSEYRRAAS